MVLSNLDCSSGSFDLVSFCLTSLGACSCTVQSDVLSAVTSLPGGAGRRKYNYKAMRNVLNLRQVGG